jgi:glucosamine kinase
MVLLIADSGSTKTDWILCQDQHIIRRFSTTGFNADIMPGAAIEEQLNRELTLAAVTPAPNQVFMYAASMANKKNRELIASILNGIWPESLVAVEHDLLGAARAACQHETGIACILGTGSNSCLYDGKIIVHEIGGQGYLFGDEGSGAAIGKELLRRMLNGYLSRPLVDQIAAWKKLSPVDIRKEAYQSERPNVYLSQFSKFVSDNISHPEIREIVKVCMRQFLQETVMRYPKFETLHAHFVGSVGITYSEILLEACAEAKVLAGRFVKSPVDALAQYHLS